VTELYLKYVLNGLTAALILLAFFFLLRGHLLPGGGFVGGLMAAAVVELAIISQGAVTVQRRVGRLLLPVSGLGLLTAVLAIIFGWPQSGTVFAPVYFHLPWLEVEFSTALAFDFGVFLVVMSVTSLFLLDLTLTRSARLEQLLDMEDMEDRSVGQEQVPPPS